MNLYFTLLLLFIALDGFFSKNIWLKTSVSITRRTTKRTEVTAVTKHFSGSTVIFTNVSTTKGNLQYLKGSSINSVDQLENLLTPEINLQYLDVNLGNSTQSEITTYSTPKSLEHSEKNVKFENAMVSGILLYAPRADASFLEQNLTRKFQKFLISFFPKLEQNESLMVVHQNDVSEEPMKVKGQGIGDIAKIKEIKEAVVDTSKIVIQDTKNEAKTVENETKKIVGRNAAPISTYTDSSTKEDTDTNVVYQFPLSSESLPTIIKKDNQIAVKTQMTEKVASSDEINSAKDITSSDEVNFSKETTSSEEYKTNPGPFNPIDKNTKYFFGETSSTDAETVHSTHHAIKNEYDIPSIETKNENLNQHSSASHTKKKDLSVHKCKLKEQHDTEHKLDSVKTMEQHLDVTNSSSPSATTRNTDNMQTSKDFLGAIDDDTFKIDVREDIFKYKNFWQHVEAARNGSLKSNSTEEFLKGRNFSLNSGGTGQSATDTSELIVNFSENKNNEPEMKLYLLEEHNLGQNLSLQPDFFLKRYRRIKRNFERFKRKKGETETIATNKEDSSLTTLSSIEIPNNISKTTTSSTDETSVTEITTEAKTELKTETEIEPQPDIEIDFNTEFTYTMDNTSWAQRKLDTHNASPILREWPKKPTGIATKYELRNTPETTIEDDEGPTKPLLLIITLPSFIGMGICILLLCYIVRPGGWCCNLFEVSTKTQETAAKEEEEKPSVSQQPQRQRIDFSKK